MELKELEYFKTVVEEGSILKASKKLHISQPPLSRMMKKIEEELDTVLFLRGKKIVLTSSGKVLYDRAVSLLSLKEDAIKEIHSLEKRNEITLQMGIVSSSTSVYIKAIENFHQDFANVRFNIKEANTYKLLELLEQNIIKIAIVRTPFDMHGYKSMFFNENRMLLLSKTNSFNSEITIKELDNKPLIIYRRFKQILIDIFNNNNIELNIIAELDDAKTAMLLANTGLGYAIVPENAYRTFEHLHLNTSIINHPKLTTRLGVIYKENQILEPIYLNFINYLKNI